MNYTLYNKDCFDVFPEIPDGSVDLVLTDIPYGEVNRSSNGLRNLNKGVADVCDFELSALVPSLLRICSGSLYVFCGTEQVSDLRELLASEGLTTRLGIWEKSNPSPMNGQYVWLSSVECCVYAKKPKATFNEHCKGSVWRYATERSKGHPTTKPIKLFEYLVKTSSNEGATVLDPFMGSGTTGAACGNLNRRFIGIEKDTEHGYFQIAETRIAEAYSNTQTKESDT